MAIWCVISDVRIADTWLKPGDALPDGLTDGEIAGLERIGKIEAVKPAPKAKAKVDGG